MEAVAHQIDKNYYKLARPEVSSSQKKGRRAK
jgi:hypothetical protein